MYNDERNKTLSELRKRTLFRRFAFILLFVILAGSLAGVGSLLFSNSSITDEAGRGEVEVEVAAITGSGTSASPWIITTKADLQAFAGNSSYWGSGTYTELAADIDWGGSENFVGVGSSSVYYQGDFNGKNHIIKNLYMSYVAATGFFKYARNSKISNFGIVGGDITGDNNGAAAIIAVLDTNTSSTVTNCFNTAKVTSTGSNRHGGIIGFISGTGTTTITNCFNTGTLVSASTNHTSGIVGYYYAGTASNLIISNCFNVGALSEAGAYPGGIAGDVRATIYNCYNVGSIANKNNSGSAGGIHSISASNITNSYNIGIVNNGAGAGITKSGTASASSCFNNSDKTTNAGGGTNLTSAQMYADNTLSSSMSGLVSGSGSGAWYKRPNEGTNNNQMFYPELKVFAEHPWKALQAYSKASVRVSGPTVPEYNNIINTAPTCTANTAVNDVPWIGNGTK